MKPDFAERNLSQVWDRLPETTRACLLVRFKLKPPGKQLPPLESTEEVAEIMESNKDVKR
jgi:hypothetical protein